jgi:hypothetical protein
MADDNSSTLINSLNARIATLEANLARTSHESKTRKISGRELQAQLDKVTADLKTLETERDSWKGKAEAAPSDLQTKLDEALGQLRARDHRDAWRDAIGGELADKATVDKVWAELQYKPGDKLPSPEEIAEQAKAARDSAPYLFKTAADAAADPVGSRGNGRPLLRDADDSSRGPSDKKSGRVTVRRSDLADPAWSLNARNQKMLAEAQADGTLVLVD